MGKVFKIVTWIIVLAVVYIWFSTVIKSCSNKAPDAALDAIGDGTEELIDNTGEMITDAGEVLFEDEDINYSEPEVEDFEPVEEIVEEVIDNTPPPERYTQNTQTTSSNSGQYMIIAGNYLVQSNANEMSKKLKNLGFGSAEVATFDNSQYHTVIASRYSDYGKAVEASSNLKAKGVDCYVKKRS
jgi:hypothetical protein